MARKTKLEGVHDFTQQIHSSRRQGTVFYAIVNHNEKLAKMNNSLCCHDCRHFTRCCSAYIGKYHAVCSEFEWW